MNDVVVGGRKGTSILPLVDCKESADGRDGHHSSSNAFIERLKSYFVVAGTDSH